MPRRKVFISPSTQDTNQYAGGVTGITDSEERWMNDLADILIPILERAGYWVERGGKVSAMQNATASNTAFNGGPPEAYIALHTNAGGGHGTECWYYVSPEGVVSTNGKRLAQNIYTFVAPESNFPDRGIKPSSGYIELKYPHAPSTIVEIAYHDNLVEAQEIRQDLELFAIAIAKGIFRYFGDDYPEGNVPDDSVLKNPQPDEAPWESGIGVSYIMVSGMDGYPGGRQSGTVVNYRFDESCNRAWREWWPAGTTDIYRRVWKPTGVAQGSWSAWVQVA